MVTIQLYWQVAKLSFQRHLSYRAATIAGLITNIFFGLLRAFVLIALYGERSVVDGLSVQDVITYTGLTQALIIYLAIFGWYDLMLTVHRGDIAADLLKPMPLFAFHLSQDAGRALIGLLLRGLTVMVIYALIFDISYPRSVVQWFALILTLLLAWWVSFGVRFLVNLTAFWSSDARGIGRFAFILGMFFSGFLMPLRFFPAWVQRVAFLTPFPHMLNTVVEVYLGVLSESALVYALIWQLLWALGLTLFGQLMLRLGTRRLVILGG